MSDVRDRVINNLKNLPETAGYDEILEAIKLQRQIEEGIDQSNEGEYLSHEEVMRELDQRVKELTHETKAFDEIEDEEENKRQQLLEKWSQKHFELKFTIKTNQDTPELIAEDRER